MRAPLLAALVLMACAGSEVPEPAAPGPLQAGVARVRMPIPVGIGTAGFGPFGVDAPPSPFSEVYPATTAVHGHPEVVAVALSRGPGFEAVLVRLDMVAVFPGLRAGLRAELRERLGRDLDDALILGASHTHGGPGRVLDGGGPYDFIADRFFPEHYERMIDAMADAVEGALDDLGEARLGHTLTTSAGHSDRRCEDGEDVTDSQLSVLAVEREGRIDAVVLGYAIHGTTVGIDALTLTQDVTGAIEDRVASSFDHPVTVALFNSWGGDMSPSAPDVPLREAASAVPADWTRQDAIALAVGDAVQTAIPDLAWDDAPDIRLRTRRVPLDRQVLGYEGDTFPFTNGATFCGGSIEADCDPATTIDGLDKMCAAFPDAFPAPPQAVITAGRLGDLAVVTFPGEPVTRLGTRVVQGVQAAGADDVFFIGYAQDYTGYALDAEDWWQGGYEANGTLWGPNQGGYLADEVIETYARAAHLPATLDREVEPAPEEPFEVGDFEPYVPETPVDPGTVALAVQGSYGPTDTVTWTFRGLDPWTGTPVVHLETAGGEPVLHGGRPVTSDDTAMGVSLATDPPYAETLRTEPRTFLWTLTLPVTRPVEGHAPDLRGDFRLRAVLGDGTEIVSAPFSAGG